jgi:hypothetical protein
MLILTMLMPVPIMNPNTFPALYLPFPQLLHHVLESTNQLQCYLNNYHHPSILLYNGFSNNSLISILYTFYAFQSSLD